MTSLVNGTCRSTWIVWLDTYHGAFVIIRSILDWFRCIMFICDFLARPHRNEIWWRGVNREGCVVKCMVPSFAKKLKSNISRPWKRVKHVPSKLQGYTLSLCNIS
jgi:acyl-CoA synthetase (AMP-forming)/AMP-acid ligase II